MIQKIIPVSLISLLILVTCSPDRFPWSHYTLNEAVKQSNNKLIMIDFYADWCAPCKQLDKNTFSNSQVIKYCEDNFINLKINTDTSYGYEIYNEFNIEYLPMIIFIDSNKNIVGTIEGYYGPSEYLDKIKKINNEFLSSSNEL